MISSTENKDNIPLKVLLFDLDGCLYSADGGYVTHTRGQLFEYIHAQGWVEHLEDAEAFWRPHFKKYNQTYRGLKEAGLTINYDEYWESCRAGTRDFLHEDKPLRDFLESLPQEKYIVSNCNEKEVIEALDALGIRDIFAGIYGAKFMLPYCKPEKEAFQKVLDDLRITNPSQCVMFEDSYKNLVTCKQMGMATVFVESEIHVKEEGVTLSDRAILDAVVPTLSIDPEIMKEKYPRLYLQ